MTDAEPLSGSVPRGEETLFPKSAGERLREAREAQGLSLTDIAARTRVPIRHLEAIESDDYSSLPTPTYAIGFAKAYARAVGEDEAAIARDVRGNTAMMTRERQEYQPYEIDDPARVPPRGVALAAAAVALVLLIGAVVWFGTDWFRAAPEETTTVAVSPAVPPPPVQATAMPALDTAGHVTLTALDRVWVRVHDASGKTLFENTMNAGDHYDVPPDADHPVVSAGRPDQLQITLNGTTLPPLGTGARPVKDAPIDAAALAARQQAASATAATAPTTAATPAPQPTPTAAPAPRHTPVPHATHVRKPRKAPLELDLKPTPPPVPAPTGIY